MTEPETVRRLEKLLGGRAEREWAVLEYIQAKYGASGLHRLPARVAREIARRPGDFLRAVRGWKQPELKI